MGIITENIVVGYIEAGRRGKRDEESGVVIEGRVVCEHLSI
jgi:hypothetical protein